MPSAAKYYQEVNKTATKTTIASSQNPSLFGKEVTITATVASAYKGKVPTGEIQFQINGKNVGDRISLNEKGEAQTTFRDLKSGLLQVWPLLSL